MAQTYAVPGGATFSGAGVSTTPADGSIIALQGATATGDIQITLPTGPTGLTLDSAPGGTTLTVANNGGLLFDNSTGFPAVLNLTGGGLTLTGAHGFKGGVLSSYGAVTITGGLTANGNIASDDGGVLHSYSGGFLLNAGLDGDISMTGNTANGDGGAIHTEAGDVRLIVAAGHTITLNDNHAYGIGTGSDSGGGGAIDGSTILITGTLIANGNSARDHAGALGGRNRVAQDFGDVSMDGNTAGGAGGAVASGGDLSLATTTGSISLTNNRAVGTVPVIDGGEGGGALAAFGDVALGNANGTIVLQGNKAGFDRRDTLLSSANGGGIYSHGAATLTGGAVTLSNNVASANGGAIFANDIVTINSAGGTVTLIGNIAGAGAPAPVTGAVTLLGRDAGIDGAAFLGGSGGAIYSHIGGIGITGALNANNNTALNSGGALYAYEGDIVVDGGHITMDGNHVSGPGVGGGALTANGGRVYLATTSGDVSLTNNSETAPYDGTGGLASINGGGAIAAAYGVTIGHAGGTTTLSGNSASVWGGAIYTDFGNITVTGRLIANDNSALGGGVFLSQGAVLGEQGLVVQDGGDVGMDHNEAVNGPGGAIATFGDVSLAATSGNVSLTNNKARRDDSLFAGALSFGGGGGAIYALGGEPFCLAAAGETCAELGLPGLADRGNVTLGNAAGTLVMTGNSAEGGGGAIWAAGNVILFGTDISGNTSTAGSGGAIQALGDVTVGNASGTLTITGNSAASGGGAIWAGRNVTLSGTDISGNTSTSGNGGAIQALGNFTLTSTTTDTITHNSAGLLGGAIWADGDVTLNATGGSITFSGNMQATLGAPSANAIWLENSRGGATLTLNAAGNTIAFLDPVRNRSNWTQFTVVATGGDTVLFDGANYADAQSRWSRIYADTIVEAGTTFLVRNNAVYGAWIADLLPLPPPIRTPAFTFTVASGATLALGTGAASDTLSEVRADSITIGGTLMGVGTATAVTVAIIDGGILAPGGVGDPVGTLTISADLALSGGATLNYDFGEVGVVNGAFNDLTVVHGNLTLAGTLNVAMAPGGSFDPGVYRVISYNGALTDNGLALGTIPPNGGEEVLTALPGQVDLVIAAPSFPALDFWDGAAGPHGNGVINGGDGAWQSGAGNTNWTDSHGTRVGVWEDGGFAIFMGQSGTVTVDDSLGAVTIAGMQIGTDGYVITGNPITLIGPNALVRIGDGSSAGAAMTATISAPLIGDARLVKHDLGTLVLTAANSYAGGTLIEGWGTVRVSADNNLGAAPGGLAFNGGTLDTTATFSSARVVTLDTLGGTFNTDPGTTLTLTGVASGAGSLTKIGAGALVLTAANSYAGGTAINGGTLRVSADANLGAATGPLSFDSGALNTTTSFTSARAATLNAGGGMIDTDSGTTLAMTGVITGAGPLIKAGDGTLLLTGANDYMGGTAVSAGTLRAGAANTFSPNSTVTVASAGVLDLAGFNQRVAGLTNAGLVYMGNAAPGTVLTITGDYRDPEGLVVMNTWLGGDGSPSDRLVIGGSAIGTSGLVIVNAGGPGAYTAGNGIEVVEMAGGGTSAGAFVLAGRVVEGANEYHLYHGSLDASGPENWYLRSTVDCTLDPAAPPCLIPTPPEGIRPDYRAEASLYTAMPAMQLLYDRALVDTLHERVGDQAGGPRLDGRLGPSQVWGRLILTGGTQGDLARGIYGDGPRYNYNMFAVQMGVDLLRTEHDHLGIYGAWGKMDANVRHWDATTAGQNRLKSWTAGGYWTHVADSGWYTDLVAQYSWTDFKERTVGLNTVDPILRRLGIAVHDGDMEGDGDITTTGHDVTLSFEAGKAFTLGRRYSIEPQAQIVWQKGAIKGFADPAADIRFNRIETLEGRFGVRLAKAWALDQSAPERLTTLWIRPSVRYTFRGTPEADFAFNGENLPFPSNLKGASLDLAAGVDGQITRNLAVYASGIYLNRLQGLGSSYGAKIGLRMAW